MHQRGGHLDEGGARHGLGSIGAYARVAWSAHTAPERKAPLGASRETEGTLFEGTLLRLI